MQVRASGDNIAPRGSGRFAVHSQTVAKLVENLGGEECDLPFVVVLEVEKTVAFNPASGHATDFRRFNQRVLTGRLPVAAKEVVSGREKEIAYRYLIRLHFQQLLSSHLQEFFADQ
jgi:hypothetical protein